MENASLILAATLWRMMSYVFRMGVIGLSVFYGASIEYYISLMIPVSIFCGVLIITLHISELNAVGQPASASLLKGGKFMDILLWITCLITLGMGLCDAAIL